MTSLVFRIRKQYFDAIVAGEKTVEYRPHTDFWEKRIKGKTDLTTAVFICGKRVHRRKILQIQVIRTPDAFSEQGKKDVPTPYCYVIYLGSEM